MSAQVSLVNENGVRATGTFDTPSTLSTNWGVFNGGRITGTISGNLRRINWSNSDADPSTCVERAISTYFVALITPPKGTKCPSNRRPFDRNFN